MSQHQEYFDALERLKRGDAPINLNSVAIEAGRGPGAIKKNRESFELLRREIAAAEEKRTARAADPSIALAALKREYKELRQNYEQAIGREISLLAQVRELKHELSEIRNGGNIYPLRTKN